MTTKDMKLVAERAARDEAEREAREEAARSAKKVTGVRSGDPSQVWVAHLWTVNVTVEMEGGVEKKWICKSSDEGKSFIAEKDPSP
jgi:hypothetical protein